MAENYIYYGSPVRIYNDYLQTGIEYKTITNSDKNIQFVLTGYIRSSIKSYFSIPTNCFVTFFYRIDETSGWIAFPSQQAIVLNPGTYNQPVNTEPFYTPSFSKTHPFTEQEEPYTIEFKAEFYCGSDIITSGITSVLYQIFFDANLPTDVQEEIYEEKAPENFYQVTIQPFTFKEYGEEIQLITPTLAYHECVGWKDDLNNEYSLNTSVRITRKITFYPQWDRSQTTINFNYNNFPPMLAGKTSGLPTKISFDKGTVRDDLPTHFTLWHSISDYVLTFKYENNNSIIKTYSYSYNKSFIARKWEFSTVVNGQTTIRSTDMQSNICQYPPSNTAIYKEEYYPDEQELILNFSYNPKNELSIESGELPPNPSHSYYDFLGWYDSKDVENTSPNLVFSGKESLYKWITEDEADKTITLYAGWRPKKYTIQYYDNRPVSGYEIRNIPSSKIVSPKIKDYNYNLWFGDGSNFPNPDQTTTLTRFNDENNDPIIISIDASDTYTITYHYQADDSGAYISTKETIQQYYPFKYWTLTPEDEGTQYSFGEFDPSSLDPNPLIESDIINFYAQWGEQQNGTILLTPKRPGYKFIGWYTHPILRDQNHYIGRGGQSWTRNNPEISDWIFYAEWEKIPCNIIYNFLGQEENYKYEDNVIIASEKPSRLPEISSATATFSVNGEELKREEGPIIISYDFQWWRTPDGTIYNPGDSFTISSETEGITVKQDQNLNIESYDLELEPYWKENRTLFKIESLPVIDDQAFIGWHAENANKDIIYTQGQPFSYTLTQSENFIALLESSQYTVTYNTNGGEPPNHTETFNSGESTIIWGKDGEEILVTKDDFSSKYTITFINDKTNSSEDHRIDTVVIEYDFNNWNTQKDGTGKEYKCGENYSIKSNLLLYAQWIERKSNTENIFAPPEEIEGYNFKGWYYNDVKIEEETFFPVENITVIAKWESKTYNIDYDANGGRESSLPKPQIKEHDKDIELSVIAPSYIDKVFIGWRYSKVVNTENAYKEIPEITFEDRTYTITWKWTQNNVPKTKTKTIVIPEEYEVPDTEEKISNSYKIWYRLADSSIEDVNINQGNWTTNRDEAVPGNNETLWTYVEIIMNSELYHPGDIYTKNQDTTFIAQWREITTLTEWLSNWETTVASTYHEDIPGNQLILYKNNGDPVAQLSSYDDWSSLFQVIEETITEGEQEEQEETCLGYGYKVKLDLVNPYNDMDDNDDITPLQRVIFVPAKMREEDNKKIWYGIYETPSDVKVLDVSLYDGTIADFNYQLHYNLNDLIDTKAAQFYEIIDSNVIGQISDEWNEGTDITPLIQNKYYAYDENGDITYENVLDSWSFLSFEPSSDLSEELTVNISTVDNPQLIPYYLNEQGLYLTKDDKENPIYLDFSNTLIKQFIIPSGKTISGTINYRATIAQKTYA